MLAIDLADAGGPALPVDLKLEFLQHTGSFKTRGAFTNLLTHEAPEAGVVAASGGNHGAAVAFAAMKLGLPATIFVPSVTTQAKIDRIRSYGAELVIGGDRYADALAASESFVAQTGALALHAYDQVETLLGQGTVAYDVTSNNFSLNQADLILESAPDPADGKRFGMRIDLQFGQATETLQGNPANELRPEIYRNIYQAYGTYIFPVGNGLNVDFGKWVSSLGYEGNYTKDQLNYSRSFWFDFLPFYHTGLRVKYQFNSLIAANLWITNGTQQTEAFNNYKDQMYGVVITPSPTVTWTINYYRGQEHPDVEFLTTLPPGQPNLPQQQGTFILPITNPPTGLLNIGDTYASLQVTPRILVAAEADYVEERLFRSSPTETVYGGALYLGYQITPTVNMAARAEYLSDLNGLYSGVSQILKEGTLTFDWRPGDGFSFYGEYRIDSSNTPFFLSSTLGSFQLNQPTIGFGAVWWFGQKTGPW